MLAICLIRSGDFTHSDQAAIPWSQVATTPRDWIKNWDASIVLKEPTKMVSTDIDNLYRYLLGRQSQGDGLEWIQSAKRSKGVARGGQDTGSRKRLQVKDESDDEEGQAMGSKGVHHGKEANREVKKEKGDRKGKGKVGSSGGRKRKSKGDRQAKSEDKVKPDGNTEASSSEVPKAVDGDKMDGTGRGSTGSSKKRPHILSGTSDGPPAKKQRTTAVDSRTTRYGACSHISS